MRAWSGLAASGKAERHYHRANAQDLPYRLRHPTFWAAPADESAAGLDSTLVRELLFPMLVFGLPARPDIRRADTEGTMHSVIYLVGLIVVVLFILSFFGLR